MKIAFMGSSQFSLIVLEKLFNSTNQVVCVVTSPDKSIGRGHKVQFSPVKEFCIKNNIPILQYENVSLEGEQELKSFNPDCIVTASFSHFLKSNILTLAPHGVINVHPSLLPKYRGPSPVTWALMNGESVTGVTIMRTILKMDAGNILNQKQVEILPGETSGDLTLRLASIGADLLAETLTQLQNGTISETIQNENESSYFPKLNKELGLINFEENAQNIVNKIRALNPWPVAYIQNKITGEIIKVYSAKIYVEPVENLSNFKVGQVVLANAKKGLIIKCNNGLISLETIQIAGSKQMLSKVFINGKKIDIGTQF